MLAERDIRTRIDKYAESNCNKPTRHEKILESILIKHNLRYESQKVISGKYIADFYLPDWGLIIEIDGDHHLYNKKQKKHDILRHQFIRFRKLYVLRIRNEMILRYKVQMIGIIREAILHIADIHTQGKTGVKKFYLKNSTRIGWYVDYKALQKCESNGNKIPIKKDFMYESYIYTVGRNEEGGLTALVNKYLNSKLKWGKPIVMSKRAKGTIAASSKGITA